MSTAVGSTMRGPREPSHRNWHSADLSQLHWHVCKHACICAWVCLWCLGGRWCGRNVWEMQRDEEGGILQRQIKDNDVRELKMRLRCKRETLQWVAGNESRAARHYDEPGQNRRDWTPAWEDETDVNQSNKHETRFAVNCHFPQTISRSARHGVVLLTHDLLTQLKKWMLNSNCCSNVRPLASALILTSLSVKGPCVQL